MYEDRESYLGERQGDLTLAYSQKSSNETVKANEIKILSLFSGCGGLDLGFVGGFKFRTKEYKK